jgi:hypothetical protein
MVVFAMLKYRVEDPPVITTPTLEGTLPLESAAQYTAPEYSWLLMGDTKVTFTSKDSLYASTATDSSVGTVLIAGRDVGAAVAFRESLKLVGACDSVGDTVAVGKLVGAFVAVTGACVGLFVGLLLG